MIKQHHAWWFLVFKGLFLLVTGLFFIFRPEMAVKGIAFYIGLVLVTAGLVSVWNTHRISNDVKIKKLAYLSPVLAMISGIILLFFTEYALTVFAIAIGIWVLFDGIDQLQYAKVVSSSNKGMGVWLIFMGVLSLVIGIVILVNPSGLIASMTILFGVILVLAGGFLMAAGMNIRE